MKSEKFIYKVTMRRRMGLGSSDIGITETQVLYIVDIGDVSLSQRIVNRLEQGNGAFNTDFFIDEIECLGTVFDLED